MPAVTLFFFLGVLTFSWSEVQSDPGGHGGGHGSYGSSHKGGHHGGYGYSETHHYSYGGKKCYQCAYSPPKKGYAKKTIYEHYGSYSGSHGNGGYGGYGGQNKHYHHSYHKKKYVPVPVTIRGGWDKCRGPFDHYSAKAYGIDVWKCHSNCYTRKDKNGNIFRGCYKGEYGVNQNKLGCHWQAGSIYCFCYGEKCNNGPPPGY